MTENNTRTLPVKTTDDDDPQFWPYWAKRISVACQTATESIIETGKLLIEAKRELDHGEFTKMVEDHLPFTPRTAERLMKIAEHPVISNPTHGSHLPPSWRTLSELALLPAKIVLARIADGTINPKMERKDVAKLTKKPGDDKAKHKARMTPVVQLKEENEEHLREIADLEERLTFAEQNSPPFNLEDDEVEVIVKGIVETVDEAKAKAIAAGITKHYKRAKPAKADEGQAA
jgi:hypothetical protein